MGSEMGLRDSGRQRGSRRHRTQPPSAERRRREAPIQKSHTSFLAAARPNLCWSRGGGSCRPNLVTVGHGGREDIAPNPRLPSAEGARHLYKNLIRLFLAQPDPICVGSRVGGPSNLIWSRLALSPCHLLRSRRRG